MLGLLLFSTAMFPAADTFSAESLTDSAPSV